MAIDTRTPLSPGWWIERLARKLTDPKRQKRFKELDDWYRGVPPLPPGAENCADAFRAFQRESRTNFAELIVTAIRERMVPIGIRTSADGDETGDAEAWRMWTRAGMKKTSAEVHKAMFTLSESYVITGPVSPFTGVPTVTAEDPRQVITEHDPADDRRIVAALKLFHDDIQGRDLAYLYLPGVVLVASRETGPRASHRVQFSSQAYSWDESLSGTLPDGMMPVRRFLNEDGTGEFETHLDLLRRINTGILQRMTIAVLQAFRQRAATGLPEKDERGQVIDYTDIFAADPGALWQLPAGVEMWESGQVDLTPVLAGTKDDVQQLGAVSRTPMHMLMPDGANQTAEGANIQREGLTFKALDRIAVATEEWSGVLSDCFLWMGDEQRADLDALTVLWRPPERLSLAERADANAKLTDVPWRTRMIEVMGYTPDQVDRMETERAADQLLASALAQQTAPQPGQQGRPGQQVPEPAPTRQGAA